MRKLFLCGLVATLIVTGCSKQGDDLVGGPYQGYFGEEFSKNKVGIDGSLIQEGTKVSGGIMVSTIVSNTEYSNNCTVEGEVKGDQVSLKFHGQSEPLELELTGKHLARENYFFIQGEARLLKGEGQIPRVLTSVKKGETIPFTFKTQATQTKKQ